MNRVLIQALAVLFCLLCLNLVVAGQGVSVQQMLSQPEKIPGWLKNGQINIDQIPNPHWQDGSCKACHSQTPVGANLNLRNKDITGLCNACHSGTYDHNYVHPSGVSIKDAGKRRRMPEEFKNSLAKGLLTCATCHDVAAQCLQDRRYEKALNPKFFREGPYKDRTGLCYKCHDQIKYKRLNAHDQVTDAGEIKKYTCQLCHAKTKDLENANSIDDVSFNVKGTLVWVCGSCHPVIPHPSGRFSFTQKQTEPNHLIVPPDKVLKMMQRSEVENQVIFPLDPNTGEIFCGTCHNPHEKGVIKNEAAAKGADERKRLRTENICLNCHNI